MRSKRTERYSCVRPQYLNGTWLAPRLGQKASLIFLTMLLQPVVAVADTLPPSAPLGVAATAVNCGRIDLSWSASVDEPGGSGLKAYTVNRSEGPVTTIGAGRTRFSDTNYVKSSTTVTYYVTAVDNAGNRSPASNAVSVTTPACPTTAGETVIDTVHTHPLGKAIAAYGARTAVIYQKWNFPTSTAETWVYVHDGDTGISSRFLLHNQPNYYQTETDYVLTSTNELWTLSCDVSMGGNLLVSQYKLNGSPPTSATLVSTKALGDSKSKGMSMIRLQSGALLLAWNQEGWGYKAYDLTLGFAYRSPAGVWSLQSPVTLPNSGGGNIVLSSIGMAQHPTDGSIWTFIKRDSFTQISALHFTETSNGLVLDWIRPEYISHQLDGDNGPEGEFPFLVAAPDPSRNAILLAYQSYRDRLVFMDGVYGSLNSIFLKESLATVAQVRADGAKSFIPFPGYMERCMQFGMSVTSDGTIWLAYQPIDPQSLTWNVVHTSNYRNGAWSTPVAVGPNYGTYNVASGARNPGLLIQRMDQPQIVFSTPDQKIHSFMLSGTLPVPPPVDTTPPATSILNPVNGANVSGIVSISAAASDNVGVSRVELLVDGSVTAVDNGAPYSFSWNTAGLQAGSHTLQTRAFDQAGNSAVSIPVSVSVASIPANLTVGITSPSQGVRVPRNQTLSVTATATGPAAVTKVEFYANNGLIATDTAAPYAFSWKVPAKRASYTIQAKAYDALGNVASHSITITAE